ncbi:MAG: type II toxin-antitoxin system VapC family toxin [Methanocellales archaeon]|nr:type II toxin-antitoxin system VapC family toxin [Methanocellales archaeon]
MRKVMSPISLSRARSPIYVDSTVFLNVLLDHPEHGEESADFLKKVNRRDILAYTSPLVFDEVCYGLTIVETEDHLVREGMERPIHRWKIIDSLRMRPELMKTFFSKIKDATHHIFDLGGLSMLDVTRGDCSQMIVFMGEHNLLPRDALHIAVMSRNNIKRIASQDSDFDRVPGIQRYTSRA